MKKLLLAFVILILSSCGKDDEQSSREADLMQGWKLVGFSIDGVRQDISASGLAELICFTGQQVCYLATPVSTNGSSWAYSDIRTSWAYDYSNNLISIAALLPVTYYIDAIESDHLQIHYYDYNPAGKVITYEKAYQPVSIKLVDNTVRLAD